MFDSVVVGCLLASDYHDPAQGWQLTKVEKARLSTRTTPVMLAQAPTHEGKMKKPSWIGIDGQ